MDGGPSDVLVKQHEDFVMLLFILSFFSNIVLVAQSEAYLHTNKELPVKTVLRHRRDTVYISRRAVLVRRRVLQLVLQCVNGMAKKLSTMCFNSSFYNK